MPETLVTTNEFVAKFANVNGSGSASANRVFARSILRMGIPVSSRNIFPSNIQGLPTWYEVRVSERDYLGRRGGVDLMVQMNPETWDQDIASIEPGGYLFYDDTKPLPAEKFRADINVLGIPITAIANEHWSEARQRQLLKNMIYVGGLAEVIGIDLDVLEALVREQFEGKDRLIEPNLQALRLGREYADANLHCPVGLQVRRADAVGDRIFIDGNHAAALGAVYGGATVAAWYPITPSTSLAEAFQAYCRRYRKDEDGAKRYAVIQAEDELASIGIVIGAGWNGARAFTATSGPGISLMSEFIGLAYFAEVPAVIFNVQRGGPSTGMPTRTQQADLLACAYASHGDTKQVLLFPEDPHECFELAAQAFDLADRLQTPIFVLSDLDIGMNEWLCRPFEWQPGQPLDRGKVMSFDDLEAGEEFGRYLDVDGDGIPFRTYPGTHPSRGAFFTRGTSKDRYARYTEAGAAYVDNMERLLTKFETAKTLVPESVVRTGAGASAAGIIYYGSTGAALPEALDALEAEGVHFDTLRVRAFPFDDRVDAFIADHERLFVIEQNRDGQLRMLLVNECGVDPAKLVPILHYDGTPITARFIIRAIADKLTALEVVPFQEGRVMTYITKPVFHHPKLPTNQLGYTRRDYEGRVSTLCAGCGHDSISAAIIQACFQLNLPPYRIAKLSGIGCSSKTPTYFLGNAHGFNSVHGRMPSVLTGANLANRELIYFGVSGDGDSASIGFGQFAHVVRRGVNMVYLVENNGVYGLTKGQFSATSDTGSKSKRGVVNTDAPIDLVGMAMQLGATFVARSFSGDKSQLVPVIEAAILHQGVAFIDCISPCVAFNNHPGSTKSFDYVRAHNDAVNALDLVPTGAEITADYEPGTVEEIEQHDGTFIRMRKLSKDYDPHDRLAAQRYLQERHAAGEVVTGLLYVDRDPEDLHARMGTVATPFNQLSDAELCPGADVLADFNQSLR